MQLRRSDQAQERDVKQFLYSLFSGEGVKARSMRGTLLTLAGVGGGNILRLASNLILTRLLFPEAFGLMALVQVFITGLRMFSDTGIRTSIIQSPRGDEPAFLNTAWTLQIMRGVVLWLCACALALPAAALYEAPLLAQILPVVGLNMILSGFTTTNVITANRHLILGRVTAINLGSQALEIIITVVLAIILQSVWALVIGGLISTAITVIIQHRFVPGIHNRLHWDWEVFREIFSFGKFIFLSTAVTFMISQGDKAILGGYVSLAQLGIYNIGYFLGSLPQIIQGAVNGKVLFPLYRLKPIAEGDRNKAQIFKARRLVMAGSLCLTTVLAYSGIALVEVMYDARYALAGPIVVAMSLALVPRLVLNPYGAALLASGDSKSYFVLNCATAILQTALMFAGVIWFGILGVLAAPALAQLLTHPLRVYYVRRLGFWDPWADLLFVCVAGGINGFACWLYWEEITRLIG